MAAFFRSDSTCEAHAFWRWFRNAGMAIAARMPMMMMTTRSSIRVKPFSPCARFCIVVWIRAITLMPSFDVEGNCRLPGIRCCDDFIGGPDGDLERVRDDISGITRSRDDKSDGAR